MERDLQIDRVLDQMSDTYAKAGYSARSRKFTKAVKLFLAQVYAPPVRVTPRCECGGRLGLKKYRRVAVAMECRRCGRSSSVKEETKAAA